MNVKYLSVQFDNNNGTQRYNGCTFTVDGDGDLLIHRHDKLVAVCARGKWISVTVFE